MKLLFEDNVPRLRRLKRLSAGAVFIALAATAGFFALQQKPEPTRPSDLSSQSRKKPPHYIPTPAEWASLTIETVTGRTFRAEQVTEGKIAVDEDRSTPVFSPYAGRITKLLARPGDSVVQGQPLFVIEAADNVQVQNDFIGVMTAMNKAKSTLALAQLQNTRAKNLFEGKAIPRKDYQQSQATLTQAENDLRSTQTALDAGRNRLRILGLSDEAISAFQEKGIITSETVIVAPIAGTVVQRKVGPGQYVNAAASEPAFVIGDLSTVWLIALVRETATSAAKVGNDLSFSVLAIPGKVLSGQIDYVASAIDPVTRRLLVRATVDNSNGQLKPEMFANVTIYSASESPAVGVPNTALVYEGDQVRVWVANEDKTVELRPVKAGLTNGDYVEILGNLRPGERIVTKGVLFIDRAVRQLNTH